MDVRDQLRMRMTRDVLRLLRVRDFREALPSLRPGEDPGILVGFRDDTLKSVLERVARLGGSAHVVVPPVDVKLWPSRMAFLQVTKGGQVPPAGRMPGDDCLVNEDSHLGMLLDLLQLHGRTMTLRICRHETTIELVDDGRREPEPALH